jgi:hypothetical protein
LQDQGGSKKTNSNTTELNNTTERVRLSIIPKTAAAAAENAAASYSNIHNYRLHIYQTAVRIQNKCMRPAEL